MDRWTFELNSLALTVSEVEKGAKQVLFALSFYLKAIL